MKTEDLLSILKVIRQLFPRLERVSAYGAPLDVLAKTPEELKLLKEAGLDMIYIGAESGDDEILQDVKKQATAEQIREACLKLKAAGIKVSVTLISGLAGRLISAVKPEYVSILTLMLEPGTPLYEQHKAGKFELLTADEVAREMVLFLENTDSQGSIFRSNHASNYVPLGGTLNQDTPKLLAQLHQVMEQRAYKPEGFRGL